MGTNYYHHRDVCECCGRGGKSEHIGKSSAGWTFSFHGTEEAKSWGEWRAILRAGGVIRNEYDEVVTVEHFEALVDAKRGEPNNHARDIGTTNVYEDSWLDEDGHSFYSGEFS